MHRKFSYKLLEAQMVSTKNLILKLLFVMKHLVSYRKKRDIVQLAVNFKLCNSGACIQSFFITSKMKKCKAKIRKANIGLQTCNRCISPI